MGRAGELGMTSEFCLRLALISFIPRTSWEDFLLGKLIEVCGTFYPADWFYPRTQGWICYMQLVKKNTRSTHSAGAVWVGWQICNAISRNTLLPCHCLGRVAVGLKVSVSHRERRNLSHSVCPLTREWPVFWAGQLMLRHGRQASMRDAEKGILIQIILIEDKLVVWLWFSR